MDKSRMTFTYRPTKTEPVKDRIPLLERKTTVQEREPTVQERKTTPSWQKEPLSEMKASLPDWMIALIDRKPDEKPSPSEKKASLPEIEPIPSEEKSFPLKSMLPDVRLFGNRKLTSARPPHPRTRYSPNTPMFQGSWLIPALLASFTGIALGFGVLYVFKSGASDLKPTVTTVNPRLAGEAANSSIQTLPGIRLTAYQVGVYQSQDRAKAGAAELEKLGVSPVLRIADQVQLLVGVSPDKEQGKPITDLLDQDKIHYYAKDFNVGEKKGPINGVSAKEAASLTGILTQSAVVIKDGIELTVNFSKKDTASAWKNRVQALNGQADIGRKILEKAGRKGELERFNDIIQQLQQASAANFSNKDVLSVQHYLLQSLIDYEELSNNLIK